MPSDRTRALDFVQLARIVFVEVGNGNRNIYSSLKTGDDGVIRSKATGVSGNIT